MRDGAMDGFVKAHPRIALLWAQIRSDEELRARALYELGRRGWFGVLFGSKVMLGAFLGLALIALVKLN